MILTSKRPQAVRITPAQRARRRLIRAALGTTLRITAAVVGAAFAYLLLVAFMGADKLIG
jgi:hypothetical protein